MKSRILQSPFDCQSAQINCYENQSLGVYINYIYIKIKNNRNI